MKTTITYKRFYESGRPFSKKAVANLKRAVQNALYSKPLELVLSPKSYHEMLAEINPELSVREDEMLYFQGLLIRVDRGLDKDQWGIVYEENQMYEGITV